MSDEALVWKFAFGVLVLLFCGVWFVARQEPQPAVMHPAVAAPASARAAAPAPKPMPAASMPPPLQTEPAPADMPEAQETPVRIRIALREAPQPAPKKATATKAKPHKLAKRSAPRSNIHFVRAPRHPSPYAIGRKHYPLDPRDRWRRELAGAY